MDHAIVIGGSMAGLLAARVLADHADHVTILERDQLPEEPVPHPGVPQSAHVHALLPGGARIIERLLPGIGQELAAAGSPVIDVGRDFTWITPAGAGCRLDADVPIYCGTRGLIEWSVRRRVLALPSVSVRGGVTVRGLRADGGSVSGVELDDGEVVRADLVVDATGRASRAPAWLQALGYDAPPETVIDANLGYATRVLDAPHDAIPGARAAFVQVAPPQHLRGGIAFPIESGQWLVTLIGTGGDRPPRDEAGYEAFAESLRDPVIADLLRAGEPVGLVAVFGATANRFRHFERLDRRPAGFLATGDAACAFNPVYGQGMSAAAMAADALGRCLRRASDPRSLADRFPRAFAAAVKVPWTLATGSDFEVAGIRPPAPVRAINAYVDRVVMASTRDARARLALLRVMGLLKPPQSLFAPRVVVAALRAGRTPAATSARASVAAANA